MITILGLIILLISIYGFIKYAKNKIKLEWFFFRQMIILSVFTNMGYMFKLGTIIYFNIYGELAYIVVCLIGIFHKGYWNMNKVQLKSMFLFLSTVFAGYLTLLIGFNLPKIISWQNSQDEVYFGIASAVIPTLSKANRYYFIRMLMFMIVCVLSQEYFIEQKFLNRFIEFVKNIYLVYFIGIFIEVIFNNLISHTILRNIILFVSGVPKSDIPTGYAIRSLMGWYGADGLFSEPSYISVSIFYLFLMFVLGIQNKKDIVTMTISGIMLVACGAQTGLLLIPLWLLIWIKNYLLPKLDFSKRVLFKRDKLMFLWVTTVLIFIIYLLGKNNFYSIVFKSQILIRDKLNAYIYGVNSGSAVAVSGSTRAFGNSYCYNAFFSVVYLESDLGLPEAMVLSPEL